MMNFTPEQLRKRFRELTAESAEIRSKAAPIREKRDAADKAHREAMAKQNAALRKAEDGLFEIERERALIARALGGRVGEPE